MQEDYGNMPMEDFTHGLYKNLKHIKYALFTMLTLQVIDILKVLV